MHKELNLERLNLRRGKHLALECHKCVHGTDGHPLKRFFQIKQQGRNRRTRRCEFDVEVPCIHTNVGRKAFSYYGPITWNTLL